MWYTVDHAQHFEHAMNYGFDVTVNGHDWNVVKSHRDAYVSRLNGIYEDLLDGSGVDYFSDSAHFVDAHTVAVGDKQYTADRIVIATGGRPIVPNLAGAELGITSDEFFELEERPERVLVIGSGYVAVELAGIFNGLGSETRVLVRKQSVVRSFDAMLGGELMSAMRADGIEIETEVIPTALESQADGIVVRSKDERTFGPADCVLWAVGRAANTAGLELGNAGVTKDDRGFVPVDDYQQTNVEHIHALGDVTGRAALTPVAIAAGRRLADRLYGGMDGRYLDYNLIPTVIFSHPPIGTIGMSEDVARSEYGDAVKVYQTGFTPMYYALGDKKQHSIMKLIVVGKEERVVGCHIIGGRRRRDVAGFRGGHSHGCDKS